MCGKRADYVCKACLMSGCGKAPGQRESAERAKHFSRALLIPRRSWEVHSHIPVYAASASNRSLLNCKEAHPPLGWSLQNLPLLTKLSKCLFMAWKFLCRQLPNTSRPYALDALCSSCCVIIQNACSAHKWQIFILPLSLQFSLYGFSSVSYLT